MRKVRLMWCGVVLIAKYYFNCLILKLGRFNIYCAMSEMRRKRLLRFEIWLRAGGRCFFFWGGEGKGSELLWTGRGILKWGAYCTRECKIICCSLKYKDIGLWRSQVSKYAQISSCRNTCRSRPQLIESLLAVYTTPGDLPCRSPDKPSENAYGRMRQKHPHHRRESTLTWN